MSYQCPPRHIIYRCNCNYKTNIRTPPKQNKTKTRSNWENRDKVSQLGLEQVPLKKPKGKRVASHATGQKSHKAPAPDTLWHADRIIKKKRNKRKRKSHMNCTPRPGTSFVYVVRISTQTSWWKGINCPLFISLPHLTPGHTVYHPCHRGSFTLEDGS